MDGGAIDLIARFARIFAIALTGCGLFLIFLDASAPAEPSKLRRSLTMLWRAIARNPAKDVPAFCVTASVRAVGRFVSYWFEQSPRNVATTGTFTLIVFVAIPLAAVLNWLRGGSPTLLLILLGCVAGMFLLAILSEIKVGHTVTQVLSAVLFAAVFLLVPGYVLVSLTDRTLGMPIGHGALTSILLAPLLYLICHSAVLSGTGMRASTVGFRDASPVRHVATLFLALLPFAFLATFGGFLFWHLWLPDSVIPSTWRLLITMTAASALAGAIALYLVSPRSRTKMTLMSFLIRLAEGTMVAAMLALATMFCNGASLSEATVMAFLPLMVPMILVGLLILALCSKAILTLTALAEGSDAVAERPYRIAGILALVLAALIGWACVAL